MQSTDEKPKETDSNGLGAVAWKLFTSPLRVLQPLLPRLIPLLVFLLCIPLVMLFSGGAGWIVWSNVPVGWKADAHLQYGETSMPFANVQLPQVLADQPYDLSLFLIVPTTESNYALGNFMVTLRLTTAYNESIITVRRAAALVPPRHSLTKQLLLGAPATVKLEVPLLSQFVSGTSSMSARLELGRSDSWKSIGNGQGRELSVVEAVLKGRVRPRGIFALLARYPRVATFASTFTFFFVSMLVVCCVLFVAVRSGPPSRPSSHKGSVSDDDDDYDDEDGASEARFERMRYARLRSEKHDSASSSNAPDDDQPRPRNASVGISSLRKRRSSPALDPVTTTRVKIEDIPTRRGTTPPLYPKSPYPRPSSTSSDSNSRQKAADVKPVSPSDADVESS